MFIRSNLPALSLVLASVVAGLPSLARGDEFQYLPEGAAVIMSGKFQDFLKSKSFPAFKDVSKLVRGERAEDIEKSIAEELGVCADNVARITMAASFRDRSDAFIGMVSTIKPVTAADILANKKLRTSSFRKVT